MKIAAPLVLGLLAVGGCQKPPAPAPVPVKGKVVLASGKPVKGLVMSFHPDDEATKSGRMPSVLLPDDGSFSVECLPGRYRVTFDALPQAAGSAATAGPGTASAPVGSVEPKDPKALIARAADPSKKSLTVEVPAGGASDLVLTVR